MENIRLAAIECTENRSMSGIEELAANIAAVGLIQLSWPDFSAAGSFTFWPSGCWPGGGGFARFNNSDGWNSLQLNIAFIPPNATSISTWLRSARISTGRT